MSNHSLMAQRKMWHRNLRNAAALARLRVLSCLGSRDCLDPVGIGAGGDVTIGFDRVAEQTMVDYLRNFSSFTLVSEEAGVKQIGSSPNGFVVMDPIDGSTNLRRNLSLACISVAFCSDLQFTAVEAGVVFEVYGGRCFHAIRGKGAFCDTHRISPAKPKPLKDCVIGIDANFPLQNPKGEVPITRNREIRYLRHLGANALELCFVANGTFDGFVDLRGVFRGTDLAAAALIVEEAGAVLVDEQAIPINGRCTNEEQYAFITARDLPFAKALLHLMQEKKSERTSEKGTYQF